MADYPIGSCRTIREIEAFDFDLRNVVEPWQPRVGDWVRVERGPECRGWHSQRGEPAVAYGRVESIDRTYDDPERWVASADEVRTGIPDYSDDDARRHAAENVGHYYYISDGDAGEFIDAIDGVTLPPNHGAITNVDGHYCAFELTLVRIDEAIREIARARRAHRKVPPGERLRRAIFGAAGEAI
jgi:hypothetical protein